MPSSPLSKNFVVIQKNIIVKKDGQAFWFLENKDKFKELYFDYQKYDDRVVKIFDITDDGKIVMEFLDGFTLDDYEKMKNLDLQTLKYIYSEFIDVHMKKLLYKHNSLKDDLIWYHFDLLSKNFMWCGDRLRLIDPDHFRLNFLRAGNFSILNKMNKGLEEIETTITLSQSLKYGSHWGKNFY